MLTSVNEQLVFGPEVHPGDPVAEYYLVQRGDLLAKIGPQYGFRTSSSNGSTTSTRAASRPASRSRSSTARSTPA